MAVTPFLKLQKPPFDTIPWDEAVNGNMDTIDAFISRYMAVPNYVGAWANSTNYVSGQNVLDISNATIYLCQVTHVSSATPTTFAQDRATYPTYWAATTNVVSGSNVALTIAEVTPLTAKAGDLWWNSAEGQLYILYNDGNSLQWVVANNQSGNIGDAPRDGNIYGRQMGAWVGSVNSQDVGRNKLHNGLFTVAQRGATFSASGYNADRFMATITAGSSTTITIATLTDTDRTQIGDDAATYALQSVCTGGAAAGELVIPAEQRLEDVRRFSSKTVILSFYARATSGTPKLGIEFEQLFGTGGSPSAPVQGIGSQAFTLSTAWVRYTATIALPTVAGKTFGSTNNTSFLMLRFWQSCGSTNNAFAGNIGVQSYTLQLWGVQLEIAAPGQTQPTPLEKLDPRMELSNCQRFYQRGHLLLWANNQLATGQVGTWSAFATTMRASPTLVLANNTSANVTALALGNDAGATGVSGTGTATGAGTCVIATDFFASADL